VKNPSVCFDCAQSTPLLSSVATDVHPKTPKRQGEKSTHKIIDAKQRQTSGSKHLLQFPL